MRHSDTVRAWLRIAGPKKLYFYALIIGAVTGLWASGFWILFAKVEAFVQTWLHQGLGDVVPALDVRPYLGDPLPWVAVFAPALGCLLSVWIVRKFSPESGGSGADAMIDAFHQKEGRVQRNVPVFKTIATLLTLGSGGSAGKEGPLAFIGSGLGATISDWAGAGSRARRSLMLAGAAGGIGGVFRSPLGGALAATEMVYREDIESDALVPGIIASVASYSVVRGILGEGSVFALPEGATDFQPFEIILFLLLGVLCFPASYVYSTVFRLTKEKVVDRIGDPYLAALFAGFLIGVIGLWFPQVLGTGFSFVQTLIDGALPFSLSKMVLFLIILMVLKIATTSLTIGSGASGGVFGPSLVLGALLGTIVYATGKAVAPELITSPAPYVLVGMGAFLAGIAHAPLTALIMVTEMSGGYELLAPMLAVAILSMVLNQRSSIYQNQVRTRFDSPAHLFNMKPKILAQQTIEKTLLPLPTEAIISKTLLLADLHKLGSELKQTDFIVVDDEQNYMGTACLGQVEAKANDGGPDLRLVSDIARSYPTMTVKNGLREAMATMVRRDIDKVAVLDEQDRVVGYASSRNVLLAYERLIRQPGEKTLF